MTLFSQWVTQLMLKSFEITQSNFADSPEGKKSPGQLLCNCFTGPNHFVLAVLFGTVLFCGLHIHVSFFFFLFLFLNLWTHKEPLLPAQKTPHLNLIQHTWGEQWLNEMFDGKKNWSVVLLNSEVQNQKYLYKKMPRGEQQSWVCMQNKKSP